MIPDAHLAIRLTPGALKPPVGHVSVNELRGGPESLLRWLETQLALPVPTVHIASRITEYANALDTVTDSVISASMCTDRWATASELLRRREELLLAGWDETDRDTLPVVVRDLARAATGRVFVFPGEADRLRRVLAALDAGQVLPDHSCALYDHPDNWPLLWRELFSRLNIVDPPETTLSANPGSSLHTAQTVVNGAPASRIEQDPTFRYVHTRSQSAAVEFIAAVLAEAPEALASTVICCEDDALALRLDACLQRIGLPTTGATAWSRAHPVLQLLPLSLALCWNPVDPQALLDFLTLPIGPLPRRAASHLATALTEEPGLGSSKWEEAVQVLCAEENDPEGKLQERLKRWLECERVAIGNEIPSRLIRSRCGMVAQWASGRATMLREDQDANLELIEALQIAAGQASLLGELAESQGAALSEPQLARLLKEALARGVQATPFIEASGGPLRVRSLVEIDAPVDRLIWLGLGTDDVPGCHWSANQLQQLRVTGIDVDDGTKSLCALRSAEARGFCYVREAFLAVLLPQDLEKRWHPVWLAIRGLLPGDDLEPPPVLEDLIIDNDISRLAPFRFGCEKRTVVPAQPSRPLWTIPKDLLSDRETVSATELQDRLACPLKWTFNYQARLHPSPIAKLPNDYQLKGTFCHRVLERVFGDGCTLPVIDDAVASVLATFDERLPLDAAPLSQPDQYLERQRLRGQLENATRVLIGTLHAGGYRIVGIEVELSGEAFGKAVRGSIDCVATRGEGEEAIIDFKYGGRSKYASLIEDGRAVQLATYAYSRSTASGTFPAVAYLVLSDGLLYTPSQSCIAGDGNRSVINAPAIQSVWRQFAAAIDGADAWLNSDTPVPARPLQVPTDWPADATLVLDANLRQNQVQDVCKYCDYRQLCGIQETT